MPASLLPNLPDEARVWIYAADRTVQPDEQQAIQQRLDTFFADWTSHARAVDGDATFVAGRFLVLAAVVPGGDISGCGIDKSVHLVEEAAEAVGVQWASPLQVFWRDAEGIVQQGSRSTFRKAARAGAVDAQTRVFDLSAQSLGTLRRDGLERPAGDTWHARVFRLATPAGE